MNKAAQQLGRLGGKAGTGKAKARTSDQARAAARVRWLTFTCPRCGGSEWGRDVGRVNGRVTTLPTVRCHIVGCGWRGEWSAKTGFPAQ
jgi:transcription elongation factor Elf1